MDFNPWLEKRKQRKLWRLQAKAELQYILRQRVKESNGNG